MIMEFKLIKTPEEYNQAIALLEAIGDTGGFEENQDLIQQFELISTLIDLYEKENFPIEPGHPLEIIKLKMETLGIQQKDLVPLIGSSGVVSEVFNRKRGLSKNMIRNFADLLHLDQNILNLKYELEAKPVVVEKKQKRLSDFAFITEHLDQIKSFKKQVKKTGMVFNINAA